MKKKGFVISWFYPPGNSSEGLVTFKLLKNSSYSYDVYTRKNASYDMWDRNTNEKTLTSENVNIIESEETEPRKWVLAAFRYFCANRDKYDFVMSRIMPKEAHEAALMIKETYPEIKWFASFGDPMVNSPYIRYIKRQDNPSPLKSYLPFGPGNKSRKAWEKNRRRDNELALEYKKINDAVYKKADLIILNNDYQFDLATIGKYEKYKNKCVVIPHSYDPDLYSKERQNKSNSKITFTHVGHLDAMRNSLPVLSAVNKLCSYYGRKKLSSLISVNFYGHIDNIDKSFILDNNLQNIVRVHPNIKYLDSLKIMQASDWQLLIDANFTGELEKYPFLPAKFADYVGSGRPILLISQADSIARKELMRTKRGVVSTHNSDEVAMYMKAIIDGKLQAPIYNDKESQLLNSKSVARSFDKIITSIVYNG